MKLDLLMKAWQLGHRRGKADQQTRCDVCPFRADDRVSVLISGPDMMRRPGILN